MRTFYPASLLTFLNTGAPYLDADLITLTLQSGVVVRLTNHDVDVDKGSGLGVFSHTGPLITRSRVTQKRGTEVSEMTLSISAASTDLLSGVPWLKAIRAGALDYAQVKVDVAVFDLGAPGVLKGWYTWFSGTVSRIPSFGATSAEVVVKNALARLAVMMPRNVVQTGCLNTWSDAGCGINKTAWQRTGTVSTINGDGTLVLNWDSPGEPTYTIDGGQFILTSGDNANVVRKIKEYNSTTNTVYQFAPFVFPVTIGTTFKAFPGCAGTQAACAAFGNSSRFRGLPYVPTPETVL